MLTENYALAPSVWIGAAMILGLCIGSFINVVIYRLPEMMRRSWLNECREFLQEQNVAIEPNTLPHFEHPFNLARPRSRCSHCERPIRPWENVPVLSYLLLRGRCSHCSAHISWRYPVVEILTGVVTAVVVWQLGLNAQSVAIVFASWVLIALSFIDIDHHLLPDNITLPLLWMGLIINSTGLFVSLGDALWGAVLGYLSLWSVYWLFKLLTGKEGMGYGDFKLLAALGAWMGWQSLPLIILISALSGLAITVMQMLFAGRSRHQPIPFGPYLAIAGWIALLWRDDIVSAYLRFSGIS